MLLSLFIVFEVIMIAMFVGAFFTKQELLWVITAVLSGFLMVSSYSIEFLTYAYNSTLNAYTPMTVSYSYQYLMGINLVFFGLALVLSLFDLFDKYGNN